MKYLLAIIIFLAAILRLYQLGLTPSAFTHDETALGYMGFSLINSPFDANGINILRAVNAFGNWTLPMYPVSTIFPIMFFGFTEFSIRLPSAISGIAGTILIYLIAEIFFKKKSIALIAALFFAISPWSIYFSRIAYETNLATTLFLGGLYSFLLYFKNKNLKLLFFGVLLFGLAQFTYLVFVFFIPCFVLVLLFINKANLKVNKLTVSAGVLLMVFTITSLVLMISGSLNHPELKVLNAENVIYNRVDLMRSDHTSQTDSLKRILHTKYLGVPYHFAQSYLASFSPIFLFDKGGAKVLNNLGYFGNFYLFDSILLVAGIAGLLWNREKIIYIILAWLLLGPIPSAITSDAPNSARLFVILPPLILIAAYGAYTIFSLLKSRTWLLRLAGLSLISLYILNVIFFMEGYFLHINTLKAQDLHYGYREAALLVKNKYSNHNVVMIGPQDFPHLSFLFYNQYDPKKFQQEVIYNTNYKGLITVSKFGKYTFVDKIDRKKLLPNTIYIDKVLLGDTERIIYLPTGKPLFTYFTKED